MLRNALVIALIALIGLGCSSSRQVAKTEATELRINGTTETVAKDSVLVEQRDTLIEVTTITIDRNEAGDTLKVVQVTDRTRARNRDGIAKQMTKTVVRTDTVYVAVRDSVVELRNYGATESGNRPSAVARALKWVFWIIVSLTVFIVVIKFLK